MPSKKDFPTTAALNKSEEKVEELHNSADYP